MIEFTKMTGLGNDYIYINNLDDTNRIINIPAFTRYICNRHFGVGADGIILIKNSKVADFKMEIYNSDGSKAEMCGNGIRCFGKYVYDKKLTTNKNLKIETLAGIRELKLKTEKELVKEVTVNMGCAKIGNTVNLKILGVDIRGIKVSMGNPHFIIMTKNLDKVNVTEFGPLIENNKVFPQKTNVEFIQIEGTRTIKMKVWERGSGETFACGTGACASFAISHHLGMVNDEVKVYLKGGTLNIKKNHENQEIFMTGLATKICDGKIEDCTT